MLVPQERQALHSSPLAQMLFCIAHLVEAARLDFAPPRSASHDGNSARQTALKNCSCFSPGSQTLVVRLLSREARPHTKALM